jgi:hypothetical protein
LCAPSLTHARCISLFTLLTDTPRRWAISVLLRCLPRGYRAPKMRMSRSSLVRTLLFVFMQRCLIIIGTICLVALQLKFTAHIVNEPMIYVKLKLELPPIMSVAAQRECLQPTTKSNGQGSFGDRIEHHAMLVYSLTGNDRPNAIT